MPVKNVYNSHIMSCKYIFKNGKEAIFIGGKYYTDNKNEIEELDAEIDFGHPHIFVGEDKTVDTSKLDPLANLRDKIIKDYLESQAAAVDPKSDKGNTNPENLSGIGNSETMAALSEGSNSSLAKIIPGGKGK